MMLIIALLVLIGQGYVCWRIWHLLPLPKLAKCVVVVFLVSLLFSLLVAVLFKTSLPETLLRTFYIGGSAWIFMLLYLVLIFGLADIVTWFVPTWRRYLSESWAGLCVVLGLMVVIFGYGNVHYHHKVRVPLRLYIDKPLRPLRIVAISDLHLGYTIGREELARWVEQINAERPDLILIAGDIIDDATEPVLSEGSHHVLADLYAPLGVYACLGNHEYFTDRSASEELLRDAGIRLLIDQAVLVDSSFYIVGRDDAMNNSRQTISSLIQGLDSTKPIFLLDHQPRHLEQPEAAGVDLQISGHTHAGQVWPISWGVKAIYEQSHGYLRKGNTHFYVTSGIGLWGGKFRLGTQSEYVVIELGGRP